MTLRREYHLLFVAAVLLSLVVIAAVSGCGASTSETKPADFPHILSTAQAKRLLLRLPYRYRWRKVELPEGATGALAGTVSGEQHTTVHFGISLGVEPAAVPVPQAGVTSPYYYYGGGFVFNDDLVLPNGAAPKQFHNFAQAREGGMMEVEMTERLCRAATGDVCPA